MITFRRRVGPRDLVAQVCCESARSVHEYWGRAEGSSGPYSCFGPVAVVTLTEARLPRDIPANPPSRQPLLLCCSGSMKFPKKSLSIAQKNRTSTLVCRAAATHTILPPERAFPRSPSTVPQDAFPLRPAQAYGSAAWSLDHGSLTEYPREVFRKTTLLSCLGDPTTTSTLDRLRLVSISKLPRI